jgi:hypothetical protein
MVGEKYAAIFNINELSHRDWGESFMKLKLVIARKEDLFNKAGNALAGLV